MLTEGPESQAVESWGATNKWVIEGGEGQFGAVGAAPPALASPEFSLGLSGPLLLLGPPAPSHSSCESLQRHLQAVGSTTWGVVHGGQASAWAVPGLASILGVAPS